MYVPPHIPGVMPNMTLALDDELHEMLKRHPEVKWSVVAREAMRRYAEDLELMERFAAKSKATDADIDEIGRKVKRAIAKHYEEKREARR